MWGDPLKPEPATEKIAAHLIMQLGTYQGVIIMSSQPRNVNLDMLFKSRPKIEFWRDNGDGTCTRLADGLTLSYGEYRLLLPDQNLTRRSSQQSLC
jgi:hypothetical protein